MPKNSSTFNSDRPLPRVFLASVAAFAAANALVYALFATGAIENRDDYRTRLAQFRAMRDVRAVVLGDSTGRAVDPGDLAAAAGVAPDQTALFTFGGATPRTLRWFLDEGGADGLEPGGLALVFLTPISLSEKNRLFERTIDVAFGLSLFARELVAAGRWENVRYYLSNDLLPLERYRNHLKDFIKRSVSGAAPAASSGADAGINPWPEATPEEMRHWLEVYDKESLGPRYKLDSYQTRNLEEVLRRLSARGLRVLVVVPPAAPAVRDLLAQKGGQAFLDYVNGLRESGTAIADFYAEGDEFRYQDAMHLARESRGKFSRRVANAVRSLQK